MKNGQIQKERKKGKRKGLAPKPKLGAKNGPPFKLIRVGNVYFTQIEILVYFEKDGEQAV